MSSPSRHVIDPFICSYSEQRPKMSISSSRNTALVPNNKSGTGQQHNPTSSWTPLVSRTFNPEMGSLNSTPSSILFTALTKPNGGSVDSDFVGLNLTPFLTHNINLMAQPSSAGNVSVNGNFTSYYDKSLHMADFFMDSPTKQTSVKLELTTPSKFDLSSDQNKLNPYCLAKKQVSAHKSKRSITQLDTPARHPTKKCHKNNAQGMKFAGEYGSVNAQEHVDRTQGGKEATPSKKKILRDLLASVLNKTPLKSSIHDKPTFHTPAAKWPVSSPSTVIMSSAVKLPDLANDELHLKPVNPPSPTPNKNAKVGTEPIMGVFSEKKTVAADAGSLEYVGTKPAKKQAGVNKFQIVFADVHTLMNGKKKKNEGHANGKLKRKRGENKNQPRPKSSIQSHSFNCSQYPDHSHSHSQSQNLHGSPAPHASPNFASQACAMAQFQNNGVHAPPSFTISQEFNMSMTSSKELSMMNNSMVNSSNPNMTTTDHASCDMMQGGMISTPNGKFLLDHLIEKQSLPVMHNVAAQRFSNVQEYMPPPPKTFSLQQAAHAALRYNKQCAESHHGHSANHPHFAYHPHLIPSFSSQHALQQPPPMSMNMLMSTPQYENVICGNMVSYPHDESSPPEKDFLQYLYQQLHQYQPQKLPQGPQTIIFPATKANEANMTNPPTATAKQTAKRKPKKR